MQELIKSLQEKTGLGADKAQDAVSLVLNFIKGKLPDSMHQYIDTAVSGNNVQDTLKGAAGKLGGFL